MAALNWNDLSETPPNAVNWDELSDTPPKETSVPERVVNTGQALGRLAKDLPTHSLAYAANIKEGSRPLDKNDWADKATQDSSKLLNERLSASDANDKTLLGTKGDWAQTSASLPFSMGSIPAAIGAGGLATLVTKNPIAGYSAGATASGSLAYRADSAMFMNSALNTFKDKYKAENNGVEPSQELMLAEQERLQPYAEDHGLWEAIPEGLGSAIGGKVVSSAFKNAGENLAVKAGKMIAGIAAEEMPSETVTQHGQHNTEIDAGVSEGEKRSFTSPSDIAQSVSEVAIPVAQQSLLMGGAAGVTSKAYDYAKERARKLQETAKTGTLGRSIAAGDIAATDTVIQPDIEEKYAAPKANPAEQIENVDTEPAFENRNSPYNDLFDAATIKHNLPDGLLNKIGHVESGFNPDAISPAGARGVMQFMPRTANEYGIDPHDTPAAIDAAGKKMAHLRDYYDGDITKAIAAYNYGEGNLNEVIDNHGDKWREHLPTETTNYLNKIIGGSNESKSSRVDSGSRSTNDVLATTVNKTKEEEPDYSSLSLDELENLHKKAIDANNDIDYEAIKKHLGEDEADNFLKLSERQKGNWWEKNADTAMEDDSSAFHGIDSDKILAHINAKNDFDIESPESLGRSIAFKMMNISSPDFKGSPDHTAIKSALEYAQDKGWDTQKIIKSARNKATEIAGADAPELFDTLFKKVENKANSEPIIKEQSKAIADQVTPIQLKENKLKSANDEKVEVKYGKNTFHVLKSELDSDTPILAAFNVKSGKQASFKLKRDKIELKDDQPTTITGNDAANGSDAERANGATDTGGAAQESNKGLTNPAQAATQPTETINGSKESTNEKRSLPTQEQERPLLNNEAPVQSGALSSGEFNPILKTKKTTWVKNRLKELQVKEGTAGYAKRLKEVQAEHANELEKAQASLPYEQFKALPDNEGIPDSLVRQAYDVLREDHGITTPIDTQAHEAATSPNNDLPAPTPAQIEAGNYKKGHINLHGLDISIENPKGSTRSGTDKDGTPWENTMTSHYGYIKGSIGADKEHVDVFVGDNPESTKAFVVNQIHPHNGKFDEHKVMLGFDTEEAARAGYLENYAKDWKGLDSIIEMPVSELKDKIGSGVWDKPVKQQENTQATETKLEKTFTGYGVIASDYLFTGGKGVIESTDYLIQALTGAFPYSGKKIDAIRGKYSKELGTLLSDIDTNHYNSAMLEIRDAIKSSYGDGKAIALFNEILANPTGFHRRQGERVSSDLEDLNDKIENTESKPQPDNSESELNKTQKDLGHNDNFDYVPAGEGYKRKREDQEIAKKITEANKTLPAGFEIKDDGDSLSLHKDGKVVNGGFSRVSGISEIERQAKLLGALTKPIANSIAKTDESNGVSNKNDQFGEADLPKFIQNIDKHRRDLLGVDDHINKANTLLPFTESTIGDHPSIEHAVDFLNRRTDAYKHFDGRLLKGGSASQSLSLKDDLLPNWSQAKQIERSFEEWKKKYPRQAQKLKENQQNVLNLNKGDKVLFPNHGAKEGDPVHDTGEILKKNPKNWIIKSKNGVELHFQPSALKPVVEDSQVDNSRLEKNSDQKPETKQYHPAIESLSNDLVEGGGVSLIHNEHGTIIGRTPSLNPDWFKDGRFQIYKPDGEPYSSTPSVREVKQAVSDYKAGNKLKAKQVAILESLHDHLVSEEEANSNKKEEDLIYNHLEKEIESGNLTIDDVEEALDEFDNGVPFDVKGGNISINELEDWLGISNEKEESTGSTDKAQGEILQNYSESELAKHEREQADRARKSAEAEVKANQSNYGKANKVFTEDAANAARERLKAKLGRLNSGFDPEMMLDGMTLAGYHIEAGAKQYGAYAKAMIADLGEGIKPYLAHFYNAVRDYPGFDNKDMASYASLEASKKIGVYPGENWRYKNQQAREVTQVNEHYITFATRDNDGRDQESISNFIASKKDWSQTDNTHGQADNDYVKNGSNPQETHHDHSEANNTGTTGNITRDSSEAPIESGVSNSQSKKPNQNGTRQSKSRVRTRQGQYDSTDLNQSEGNGLLSEHEGLVGHETNESTERSIGGQTSADTGVSKSIGADNYSLLNKKPIALTPAKRRDVNILAEEILKKPVNEITEDDKNILRQYTGNGGLDVKASADKGEAIFNQHYSAYDTIKAMYGALMDAGIKMVNNLEPSVGSGNFIGMHPRANWTSVDIDKTNTEIVKRLYPDAKVFHESYETFRGKNYDLIISNVPFASFSSLAREHAGTIKPMFKAIHNFFFAQSIDKLKTGGVMAFMTSTGTMDGIGEGQRLRQHLVKHMDVIGAYRLPMGTQKANASTEVMIDVIFLQKRPEGVESKQPEKNNAFVNVTNKGGYKINQYFADYPESVLGELSVGANKTSMGKVGWIVTGDADYSRMKVEPQDYASTKKATQDRFAGPEEAAQYAEKQGLKFIDGKTTPFFKDGFVYDQLATYSEFSGGGLFGRKATGVNADKMAALQKIEETTDSDLVRSYENKYGKPPHTDKLLELWAKTNHAAKQLKAYLSLFDKHFNLSEIFTKKVRFENSGKIEINENSPLYDRAESLEDANGIFSTKNNLLSDDEMQGLLDSNDYAKLSNGHFQNARLYYAGNIYQKLDDVQKVKPATQRDKQIARLERVKPTLILIKDLTITGKEKWMPDSAIAAIGKQTYPDGTVIIGERAIDNNYFLHLFNQYLNNEPFVKKRQGDTPEEYAEQLKAAQNTLYSEVLPLIKQKLMDEGLSDEVVNAYNRAKNFFAPPSFDGSSLRNLPKTFRGKPFKLMRHQLEGAERAIYNKKGVLAFSPGLGKTPTAIVVADQLLQKGVMKKPLFIVPANTIPQWEATTRDLYPNAKVYEFPKYTSGINKGKPKDWPSMSAADKEKMVHDLTNNQYDYTFISTNLAQKITIPTDKLSQYVDDLAESISGMEKPDEELNKSQLKAKATRLAKIKMLKATIMASYAESNKNGFDMGKMGFDALFADEVQYYKNIGMQSEEAKGGIGANVAINAKYPLAEDEKGKLVQDKTQDPISVSLGSSRSYDFRFKTQFISEKNNGNNIFLLTGTPTPNKPLELMTLLHHLDIHILDEYGIDNVGDFVNEFLDVQEVEEIGVDGSAKLKPQLVSLQNIFGLKKIITRFIDYRSPESATDLTRPKQKDVTHIILQNETSEAIFADVQERILKSIEDANEKRSGNIVEAEQMIAMYSAGRDASVDVRLYTPSKIGKGSIAEGTVFKKETRSQYSKIAKTVELVAAKNKQDPEAGQLIFLDRLKFSDGSGSTHEDIRNDILEATGLSPQEVVFVNGGEYVNPKTGKIAKNIKPEMLQTIMDDYNAGKIKVLIGNTSKLGVGVDLQTTTTDIYQLDKPYRPDEIEQRNNRGVRQGNRNAEVTVHTFNQPGTFDAMSDRIIASKQGFNDVFWKDQASDKADVKGEEAPGHYDAAIELERDPVRKRKLEIERDLSQASAKTNNLEKQVSNLAKRIKSVTESKTQYKNANQGIDTREAPKYEDQTDAERKKSLAAWKQRQADQRALNVKRIGDLTEDLKTLEESKAQRIEELEAHKAHIASIRNQYVVNGVVNLDAIKNGGNQDAALFSKSTQTTNPHTLSSLTQTIKSIMDKAFGDGWTNRLLSTGKFKVISRDEAVGLIGKNAMFHKVWHGSPHDHDKFDSSKIGTGEGAQAFGYGHYFTDAKSIAEWYRDTLSGNMPPSVIFTINGKEFDTSEIENDEVRNEVERAIEYAHESDDVKYDLDSFMEDIISDAKNELEYTDEDDSEYIELNERISEATNIIKNANIDVSYPDGKLYEVDLAPSQDEYLDWDKPLSEQSDLVKSAIRNIQSLNSLPDNTKETLKFKQYGLTKPKSDGSDIYAMISSGLAYINGENAHKGNDNAASKLLQSLGIRGIRYKAEGGKSDSNNYVVFDDNDINIDAKYSKDGQVLAFYNPADDTTYFVHDNISQDQSADSIKGLMLHEIASHALKLGKSSAEFKSILARFEKLKAIDANIQAAFDRVPKDTNPEHATEEALSYYLEKNPRSTLDKRVIEWFRQAIRAIGNTLVGKDKYLFSKWANELTHTELVNMANKALKYAPESLQFDNVERELEDSPNLVFSKRTKSAPIKTIIAYKLFRIKKSKPGELFPLFVKMENDNPVPIGTWEDAEIGEQTNTGKVKSKLGPLAFRPGWHMGDSPASFHIGGNIGEGNKPTTRLNDQVWAEVEVSADIDYQPEANANARIGKNGQIVANTAHITDKLPVDGFYRYKTNANMVGNWIIAGSMKINRVLSDDEVSYIHDRLGTTHDLPRETPLDLKKLGFDNSNFDPNDANIYNQSNLQTDTPAFKKWFGESKMVDAEGKPLVVYHGTTKYFHTFRTSWAEGQGKGVYFSTDKNDTLDFSDGEDGNLIEAYLKMEKPYLDTEDPDFETDDRFWEDVDYRNKMLQEHGYDGVISPQGNGLNGSEILVFDPAQIKSATENNGDFSSDNNDIRFSKSEPSVGEHYTLPAETKPRHQQRLWQDMNNRWTVIQDVIKKAGGVINDANNVYQAMELMPSKAGERIRDYRDTYITPLYDRMTKAGVTLNDLALFNYATHAEERNLAMSKINPRFSIDNGSGMTNQEAIDTLEELKLHYGSRFGELEKLAKEFRAITDDTLNILVDAGVMTQDAVDKMRATYQNYVPLKGFEKVDENGNQTNGTGLGHSTGKAFSKRALGRESKAGQIIENIIRDHERAIVWAEKTEVAKTLGNFVQDFPDDKLWTLQKISLKPTLTPGKREFFLFYSGSFVGKAKTAKDMRRFRDAEIARTGQDKKDYRINVIKADDKVGAMPEPFDPEKEARYIQYGKEVRIQIHDPLALKAFNKLGDQSDNEIFRLAGVMNRFLRQMWTQKNPAFFLINPIRDVQTASIYLTGEGSVTLAGKALKHWGSSWKTMWNHARNKQSSPTEQAILDRYRKSGGMVGTAYISSLDKINEDIHHQLQRFGGEQIQDLISAGKIREAVSSIGFRVLNNKLFDGIENLNTAFECATRLATFKAAVDSGYTDKQAAALALNVTVNFTKKGEYGRELGAMYLFANANIQGNANVFKTLTQSNYRGQAWAIAGSLAVLGFMAAMASGDDGEDELIGDYEKERNLIFDLGEGKRFTIPVAYGWSIFMDLGRAMARAMNGGDTEAISKKLASSFLGNFSPIGNPIPNGELSADNAIVAFAPTFSKPFVMPAVNKTSFGTPLMPESPFKPNQPDSEKVYRKTRGTLYDSAAETLNSVTGGDAVQSGWIDVSPETLKNTWNYLLGGAGRFITDTESMAQTALSVNEESKPESWPIVKTFYKSESIDDYRRRYYEQADRIVKANEQFSAYKKAGEIDKAKEMIRDNGNLIRLKVYSSGVRDKLKAIRDKEDEIRKAGGDIRLLNALESRERKILSDFSAIAAR